jgi:hypothetical protein
MESKYGYPVCWLNVYTSCNPNILYAASWIPIVLCIFFLVYQCLNTVPFQSLNYVHVYDIYKPEVYTYNSQVGLNKTASYEYHIHVCIYKNYIWVNLQRMHCQFVILKIETDTGSPARFYILKRSAHDSFVNPYNKDILSAWKANMDIQFVGSMYTPVVYTNHIFFLVYQCLNTVPFQSLNYVHVYDIYKPEVYTYNSHVWIKS